MGPYGLRIGAPPEGLIPGEPHLNPSKWGPNRAQIGVPGPQTPDLGVGGQARAVFYLEDTVKHRTIPWDPGAGVPGNRGPMGLPINWYMGH